MTRTKSGGLTEESVVAAVRPRSLRLFLLAAFFLTGATGLIYQVLWSRMLVLSFGYTIYSVSTVITAFMGGLAAGSVAGGALADRVKNPALVYGAAEAGVGVLALVTYPLLTGLPHAIAAMRGALSIPFYGFNVWTFLITIAILAPPAALMGLTLPLLARAMTTARESASSEVGSLYALNTLGAAGGSLATGFVLIAVFGIFATIVLAATINVLVGLAAIALFWRAAPREPRPWGPEPAIADKGRGVLREPIFWAFGVSGFASLAAEVIWIRTFSPYLENSTYAFSLILAIFLLGIAAGSWAGRAYASGRAEGPEGFAFCQVLAGVSTGVGLILLFVFIQRYYAVLPSLGLLIRSPSLILEESAGMMLILLPSTFFLGAGFPFIARWAAGDMGALGGRTGKLYAANTVGSILGAVGGGFLMFPLLGTRDSLVFLAALYMLNGGAVMLMNRGRARPGRTRLAALCALLVAFALTLRLIDDPNVFAIRNAYKDFDIAAYREDPDVNVVLLRHKERAAYKLYLNLRLVSGSGWLLTPWMTHLPLMLQDAAPSRMLIIGLGIGHAYNIALAHYPDMLVEVVELVPSVVDLYFGFNPASAEAKKMKNGSIIIADGRNYLLTGDEPYDAVLIDPTPPLYGTGAVNLYTADFFRIVKKRLTPEGIFLLRIPQSADEASVRLLLRTVVEVFPHVSLWKPPMKNMGYSIVASSFDYRPEAAELARKVMENPRIDGAVKAVLLEGVPVYIGSGASLIGDPGSTPVVTDDRPYLEFPLYYRRGEAGQRLP